ncbi:MAG TPA: cation transporter [Firmicutes bacterium]|jgi:cation diffusion facilitator family transporter|nr:cation transporter [Bacillota bacterium]
MAAVADNRGIRLKQRLSRIAVIISITLLGLKLWAWSVSHSLAILSDTLNSLLDVFSYTTVAFSMRIQDQAPDASHPFGHRRAEPLAGMLIAIVAALLGFNLAKDGVLALIAPSETTLTPTAVYIMVIAIAAKIGLVIAYDKAWKITASPAIYASMVDSRNDILMSCAALFGFLYGGIWDASAALIIGLWVMWSGVRIGLDNMDYLMGKTASTEYIDKLRRIALSVPGVLGTNDIRAHYVGDQLHVELHAEVSAEIGIVDGHLIEVALRDRLEALDEVGHAFIHLDPVRKPPV